MSPALFIRLPATPNAPLTGYRAGPAPGPVSERFAEALAAAGGRAIVLAPGTDVLLTRASLPTRNRKRMLKAVPFALEEQLISDIDSLHFALGAIDTTGPVTVAVVDRPRLRGWLDALQQQGLQAETVIPEPLALPWQPDTWTLLIEPHQMLVRHDAQQGWAVDGASAATVLRSALRDAGEQRPQRLHVHLCAAEPAALAGIAAEFDVALEVHPCTDPLALFAEHYTAASALNLLQGEFSRKEQLGKLWQPWRTSLALAAAWLVLVVGARILDYQRLTHQQQDLQQQIEQVYRQAFPNERNIVNPRVQMERHLAELGGGGSGDVLALLTQAGPTLKAMPGLTVKSLRSQGGELELELNLQDLAGFDQLKQRLTEATPLEVEIVSASSRDGKIEGRLKIRSKS